MDFLPFTGEARNSSVDESKKSFIDPNYKMAVKAKFFHVNQRNYTIASYVNHFRSIVNQLGPDYVSDAVKMDVFILGLTDRVAGNVKALNPTTLEQAICRALSFDNGRNPRHVPVIRNHTAGNRFSANQLGGGYTPMEVDAVTTKDYSTYKCYKCGGRGHIKSRSPKSMKLH